jgi:uncharacterized membrane protein YphA (DoxX/SURF4 family)
MDEKRQRWKGAVGWGLRIFLAGLFFYAGGVKVADPTLFAIKVRNYELLADPWVAVVALALPWLEIFCALCIVTRRWERGALLLTAGMLLVFLFGLGSAWARGLDIDCGCFSEALDRGSLLVAVAMDLLLLVMVVVLFKSLSQTVGGAVQNHH